MAQKLKAFDPAEHLLSDEAIADFLDAASQTKDVAYIAHAHCVVAQAMQARDAKRISLPNEEGGSVSVLTKKKSP